MEKIIAQISAAILGSEFEDKSYLVGGFVRDRILGKVSNDLDIVVALDEGGIRLAEFLYQKGISTRPVIFKKFGTAFVMIDEHKVEFVMTRKESYRSGSRKPTVTAGSIEEDIFRRDFTVNSLLMRLDTYEVIDITGRGLRDLEDKIIRATSDPEILFSEDPLRMLRAVRFSVGLDYEIESETFRWIKRKASAIRKISVERIQYELQKIILYPDPVNGINLLLQSGLLQEILPEMIPMIGLKQNKYHIHDVFGHTLEVLSHTSAEINLRLAALFHDIAKPLTVSNDESGIHFYGHEKTGAEVCRKILNRLKFPNKTRKQVSNLVRYHMDMKQAGASGEKISDRNLRKLIMTWQEDLDLFLNLVHADNLSHAPEYILEKQIPGIRARIEVIKKDLTKEKLPVKGKDIINYFKMEPGIQVGEYLNKSQNIWLDHPHWDKDKILEYLKFKEEKMVDESKVTQKVKEGVVKAYEVGEDVVQAIGKITKEVISTTKDEDLSSKEKVHKLAHEALEGAKQGIKTAQPPTEEFIKKASKTITEAIKVAAPKVSHFAQEAFKGIYEGAKDVYVSKKGDKKD